jgi:hypothetical protein
MFFVVNSSRDILSFIEWKEYQNLIDKPAHS